MAEQDFQGDSAGFGWVVINLIAMAWITMPLSIALSRMAW